MRKICLLKETLPNDILNGGDLRFMNMCSFLDEVFFVYKKNIGASGKPIKAECKWNCTKLKHLEEIEVHLERNGKAVWIVGDYASFQVLQKLGMKQIIYDNCDSQSLYFSRRLKMLPLSFWKKKINAFRQLLLWRYRENKIVNGCSAVVVPAEEDKKIFLRHGVGNVEVITNGTDWVETPPIKRRSDACALMFHGAFSWPVNQTTAEYLVRELYPVVRQNVRTCEVRIAGNPIPENLKDSAEDDGVYLEGFVDDIREWLSGCAVYVMPMFQGGGVKNKLLEAMAAGLPVVTNSMGAEALPLEARAGFVVADGTEAIAAAVCELLRNPAAAESLGAKAREYAVENFRWDSLESRYRKLISSVSKM
jgi:glycosyltransferase involved in cell wall biosynthesis